MKLIIREAEIKFDKLAKKYAGFINVIVDDWRGWRFIFDTDDVRGCYNNCAKCPLFELVKKERPGIFSAVLYRASQADKELFGPQNFLNCKTLAQYGQGYVKFIKRIKDQDELREELNLVKNFKIVYARAGGKIRLEKNFKRLIFSQALKQSSGWKRGAIKKYIKSCCHET